MIRYICPYDICLVAIQCKQKVRTEGTLIYHSEPLTSYSPMSAYEREWQMEQVARDNQWQTEALAKWLRKRLKE